MSNKKFERLRMPLWEFVLVVMIPVFVGIVTWAVVACAANDGAFGLFVASFACLIMGLFLAIAWVATATRHCNPAIALIMAAIFGLLLLVAFLFGWSSFEEIKLKVNKLFVEADEATTYTDTLNAYGKEGQSLKVVLSAPKAEVTVNADQYYETGYASSASIAWVATDATVLGSATNLTEYVAAESAELQAAISSGEVKVSVDSGYAIIDAPIIYTSQEETTLPPETKAPKPRTTTTEEFEDPEEPELVDDDEGEETTIHTHTMGDWVTYSQVTCTSNGEERRYCLYCEYCETRRVKAIGHKMSDWSKDTATCTCGGSIERHCLNSGCDHQEVKQTSALGHSYGDWNITAAATCGQEGRKERVCSRCGNKEYETIPKTNHVQGDWRYNDAQHWHICKVCGTDMGDHESHNFLRVSETPATEYSEGWTLFRCQCGAEKKETTPKLQPQTKSFTARWEAGKAYIATGNVIASVITDGSVTASDLTLTAGWPGARVVYDSTTNLANGQVSINYIVYYENLEGPLSVVVSTRSGLTLNFTTSTVVQFDVNVDSWTS